MRALAIVFAVGLALAAAFLIGVKGLDEIANGRPEVAIRAGSETYFIPTKFVRAAGWRAVFLRAGGCWDARDAAMVAGLSSFVGCDHLHRVSLALPTSLLGPDVAMSLHKPEIVAMFWPTYQPPADQTSELADAWAGRGTWAGRRSILRADWQLWRIEMPAGPWVYLLSRAPEHGDGDELRRLYAGRCYRPEKASDAGMTCSFALRIGASAVLEFSLSADEMMSFVALREALMARAGEWRGASSQ